MSESGSATFARLRAIVPDVVDSGKAVDWQPDLRGLHLADDEHGVLHLTEARYEPAGTGNESVTVSFVGCGDAARRVGGAAVCPK